VYTKHFIQVTQIVTLFDSNEHTNNDTSKTNCQYKHNVMGSHNSVLMFGYV